MKLTVWLCSVEGGNPLRQKTPHKLYIGKQDFPLLDNNT